jgi:hypothetical protein
VIWLTLLAAKDADGFARFASVENLARRAIVEVEEAETAIAILEAPDPKSSNPAHEGRRVERVPGGWMVLNAGFYDELVRRDDERRMNRDRVRRHREKHKGDAQAPSEDEPGIADAVLDAHAKDLKRAAEPVAETLPPGASEIISFMPEVYRRAVEGAIRAHRTPVALVAEFDALNQGMHGKPQTWATIGRAVHEMQVAGAAMTARALRAFCEGTGKASGNGNGSNRQTKSDRMYEELGAFVADSEAKEAASRAEEVVEAEIEPATEKAPF